MTLINITLQSKRAALTYKTQHYYGATQNFPVSVKLAIYLSLYFELAFSYFSQICETVKIIQCKSKLQITTQSEKNTDSFATNIIYWGLHVNRLPISSANLSATISRSLSTSCRRVRARESCALRELRERAEDDRVIASISSLTEQSKNQAFMFKMQL